MTARAGLGEVRSISDAPGHLFDAFAYHERDQLRISDEQGRQVGLLVGLITLLVLSAWDGWLVSDDTTQRIEFWEGNVFFHDAEGSRLNDAKLLMTQYECSQVLV
jgi:hypothetical protein